MRGRSTSATDESEELTDARGQRAAEPAASLGAVPVCLGCGLAGDVNPVNWLCGECWRRRERRLGGGDLRVVTLDDERVHETLVCPAVRGEAWQFRRYEDVMYEAMHGRRRRCPRCYRWRAKGLDYYVEADRTEEVPDHV